MDALDSAVLISKWAAKGLVSATPALCLGLLCGIFLSGCSDSNRLKRARYSERPDPFSNPFANNARAPAQTVPMDPYGKDSGSSTLPDNAVEKRPLPLLTSPSPSYAPVASGPLPYAAPDTEMKPSFTPSSLASAPAPVVPLPIPQHLPSSSAPGGWSIDKAIPIIVAPGDTAESLARRYGVPLVVFQKVNHLNNSALVPGSQLIVPVYQAAKAPASLREERDSREREQDWRAGNGGGHGKGSTLSSSTSVAAHLPQGSQTHALPKTAALTPGIAKESVAENKKSLSPPTPLSVSNKERPSVPEFRWPVHGRVIIPYQSKGNTGINIAVPMGTPVKAAESGYVVYAQDGIKDFGYMVLIRHEGGFTSVYAHNSELKVKQGEYVKRGQVIAISGQTGKVVSPQVHFELREKSVARNPMDFLPGS